MLYLWIDCKGGTCPRTSLTVRKESQGHPPGALIALGPIEIATNQTKKTALRLTARGRRLAAKRQRLTVRTTGRGIASSSVQLRVRR